MRRVASTSTLDERKAAAITQIEEHRRLLGKIDKTTSLEQGKMVITNKISNRIHALSMYLNQIQSLGKLLKKSK
jgi:hypothetical protein